MDNISAIGQLFAQAWHFFELEHPLLGISYGSIAIGFFVVCFSVTVLKPILGIGSGAVKSATSFGREIRRKYRSERDE